MTRSLVGAAADARRARVERDVARARRARRRAAGRRAARRSAVRARRRAGRADLLVSSPPDEAARDRRPARPVRRRRRRRARRRAARAPARRRRAPPDRRQRGRPGALLRDAAPRARPLGPRRRTTTRSIGASRSRTPRTSLEALPEGLDDDDRRARPLVLGRPAPAARARARAALRRRSSSCSSSRRAPSTRTPRRGSRERLREARPGGRRSIVTTSPLVLDQADRVVLVEDGRVVAEGAHRELLRDEPRATARPSREGRTL